MNFCIVILENNTEGHYDYSKIIFSLENRHSPRETKFYDFLIQDNAVKEHEVIEKLQSFQLVNGKSLKEQVV